MIKRAYIIHKDCEIGKRALSLFEREKKGKPFFIKKEEWNAILATDWQEWNKEACKYIVHIYQEDISGIFFDVSITHKGDVYLEESDRHFTNIRVDK